MSDITGHDAEAGVVAARFKAALHAGLRAGQDSPTALQQAANVFRKTPNASPPTSSCASAPTTCTTSTPGTTLRSSATTAAADRRCG